MAKVNLVSHLDQLLEVTFRAGPVADCEVDSVDVLCVLTCLMACHFVLTFLLVGVHVTLLFFKSFLVFFP